MHRVFLKFPILAVVLLLALAFIGPVACGTAQPTEEMDYSDQAEYLYRTGQEALERGNYLDAINRFNTVRNEFPYSRWAAEANLGIGDAYFEQEQYASAVQQYRGFINLYPRHERVEYARWRVALAFYEQMPSDFFILPPPHERDLSTTRDAVRELHLFVRNYPESEYADDARQKWRYSMRRLANHEYYVADYYMDRDNPTAAVQRLRFLLQNYSGLGLDAEALFMLGRAYLELEDDDRAATAFRDLVNNHPDHARARQAQRHLEQISPTSDDESS